jgi:hypothetical protein
MFEGLIKLVMKRSRFIMKLWADFSLYPSNDGKLYFLLEKYAPLP